jgi:ornithine cyclodeaminase/alanine dehydrogenase-like protein (mu-crystallin family)
VTPGGTRILRRSEVAQLLTLPDCITAVESAFRLLGEGKVALPGILGMHVGEGGFHIKAAVMDAGRAYFAAKSNANFPDNPRLRGLPAIQGTVSLCDASNGYPLALMDSIEITILRTAAATAVAARHLARADSAAITICGCGNQGRAQLRALRHVLPRLQRAYAFDQDPARARAFAAEMSPALGMPVEPTDDLPRAVASSDVCVACTPSRTAYLGRGMVRLGTFVAGVGADNPEKSELDPSLLAAGKVVVDSLAQASTIGDLHHAIAAGAMTVHDVHAELADVVAGRKAGRTSDAEITVFDSTGIAVEDVAAAIVVYERAAERRMGLVVDFAA